jgi:hypothetical protein
MHCLFLWITHFLSLPNMTQKTTQTDGAGVSFFKYSRKHSWIKPADDMPLRKDQQECRSGKSKKLTGAN